VTSHFEVSPAEYERQREGHMQRRRRELVSTTLAANARPGATVVELGCGPGGLTAALAGQWPGLTFLGIDLEESMVEHARRAHAARNLSFRRADLQTEVVDVQAEVAFSVDLVHHVHDLDAFLANVRRMLAPRGVWVVVEPNMLHPYVLVAQERMRRRGLDEDHFRPWRFRRALGSARLVIEHRRTAFLFPGWIDHVARPLERVERILERVPVLGGSVVYTVRAI
jgi:trans-aconitate methyltransferase